MTRPVDPQMRRILAALLAAPAVDLRALPMAQARATFETQQAPWRWRARGIETRDLVVPGAAGAMAARLYLPRPGAPAPLVLYAHGGGWTFGSIDTHDTIMAGLANDSGAAVLGVDYRLAPEHPFPAGIDDVVACYRRLLAIGHAPERIGLVGDSAGGGLALAALLRLRDSGEPLPAAFVALSPWADLTFSGGSVIYNARTDPFMSDVEFVSICTELYLQGTPASHQLASPALADLNGLPPTLVHVGSTDLLLDDSRRIVSAIKAAGGKARLDIWRNMPHVWQRLAAFVPAASASLAAIGQFLRVTIPDEVPVRWDSAA